MDAVTKLAAAYLADQKPFQSTPRIQAGELIEAFQNWALDLDPQCNIGAIVVSKALRAAGVRGAKSNGVRYFYA